MTKNSNAVVETRARVANETRGRNPQNPKIGIHHNGVKIKILNLNEVILSTGMRVFDLVDCSKDR